MQFKVAQILKEPIGATRDYLIDETIDIVDTAPSRVTGSVRFMRTNRGILVKGRFSTGVDTTCVRCLEGYTCPLSCEFEEEYFSIPELDDDDQLTGVENGQGFLIGDNFVLDVTEAVRQYAILAIPMKPLCNPDCPGVII